MKATLTVCLMILAMALALSPHPVAAMGSENSEPRAASSPEYDAALDAVKAEKYTVAIGLLEKVVSANPNNADAYNYLGYSYRKMSDFEGALRHYAKALELNPSHRGANEYLGELHLKMGDVAKAEERLKKLDSLCFFGCEEYDMLKKSIDAYKSGKMGAGVY